MRRKEEFLADGGRLIIEFDTNVLGWSRCYLLTDKKIYLGAESTAYIVTRLLDLLREESVELPYEYHGEKVRWIMSLAEAHHCLYATAAGHEQKLLWQDAHSGPSHVATFALSPRQRLEWRDKLESIRQAYEV